MRRWMIRNCTATMVLGLAALAGTAHAGPTTTIVELDGVSFTPADVEITVGDTVRWLWVGGLHNVESGVDGTHDGNFRSGDPINFAGQTFEVTFDEAFLAANPMPDNVYPYYCIVHLNFGMAGTVTVDDPILPCLSDCDGSGDGEVNVADLLALLAEWGGAGACDVNGNGVEISDLLALLSSWGSCP